VWVAAFAALGARHPDALSAGEQAALQRISAASMRASVSFLSSEALGGRATPSSGLDISAEFIAAQFRRAGLEPISPEDGYFQTARLIRVTPAAESLQLTFHHGEKELKVFSGDARLRALSAVSFDDVPVIRLQEGADLAQVAGKVVAAPARQYSADSALEKLQAAKPALILLVGRRIMEVSSGGEWLAERDAPNVPVLRVFAVSVADALAGHDDLRLSLHASTPVTETVVARNVGGILRGSDPTLRDQFVLLTAHYDHLGKMPGANDNASGTVSMIEIAAALSALETHPRRSILFLAFYGEEEGLLGSSFYVHHPLEPLKDTVADINLEQMGRTDEEDGKQVGAFAFTGPSYSDLPAIMSSAAKPENVKIYSKRGADMYFDRSDNYVFAQAGIVAHTIVVAFEYPDYHASGDEWQKLDYENMARVDRGVAAGLLQVANISQRPKWSGSKEAAPFREAAK